MPFDPQNYSSYIRHPQDIFGLKSGPQTQTRYTWPPNPITNPKAYQIQPATQTPSAPVPAPTPTPENRQPTLAPKPPAPSNTALDMPNGPAAFWPQQPTQATPTPIGTPRQLERTAYMEPRGTTIYRGPQTRPQVLTRNNGAGGELLPSHMAGYNSPQSNINWAIGNMVHHGPPGPIGAEDWGSYAQNLANLGQASSALTRGTASQAQAQATQTHANASMLAAREGNQLTLMKAIAKDPKLTQLFLASKTGDVPAAIAGTQAIHAPSEIHPGNYRQFLQTNHPEVLSILDNPDYSTADQIALLKDVIRDPSSQLGQALRAHLQTKFAGAAGRQAYEQEYGSPVENPWDLRNMLDFSAHRRAADLGYAQPYFNALRFENPLVGRQ